MSIELIVALVGGGSAILGAIVGTGGTLFAGFLSHRREARHQENRERREREKAAAERCGELFRAFCKLTLKRPPALNYFDDDPESRAYRDLRRELSLTIAQLEGSIADRVSAAQRYVEGAYDIGKVDMTEPHVVFYHETHYEPAHIIIDKVSNEVHTWLVTFIKGYPLPPLSGFFIEIEGAWEHYDDYVKEWGAEQSEEEERERQRFLANFPSVRKQLDDRRRAELALPARAALQLKDSVFWPGNWKVRLRERKVRRFEEERTRRSLREFEELKRDSAAGRDEL